MLLFSITISSTTKNINNLIDKILKNYKNEEIDIDKKITDKGEFKIIDFDIQNFELSFEETNSLREFYSRFKHYTAIAIADYIVDVLEAEIIEEILLNNYYYLKPTERKDIIEQLNTFLESEFHDQNIEVPYRVNKKAKILYKLMDFMNYNDNINVEGFVNFRLKNYSEDLSEVLDRVIEEYMMEKEYKEFIKLLKYFVNIQDPKIDLLNIMVDDRGKYHFYDKNNKVIDDSYIKALVDDLMDTDLNYDDLLISSLITIAPERIIIHYAWNIKNPEIIETIKNIFDKRVDICTSCRICNLKQIVREE